MPSEAPSGPDRTDESTVVPADSEGVSRRDFLAGGGVALGTALVWRHPTIADPTAAGWDRGSLDPETWLVDVDALPWSGYHYRYWDLELLGRSLHDDRPGDRLAPAIREWPAERPADLRGGLLRRIGSLDQILRIGPPEASYVWAEDGATLPSAATVATGPPETFEAFLEDLESDGDCTALGRHRGVELYHSPLYAAGIAAVDGTSVLVEVDLTTGVDPPDPTSILRTLVDAGVGGTAQLEDTDRPEASVVSSLDWATDSRVALAGPVGEGNRFQTLCQPVARDSSVPGVSAAGVVLDDEGKSRLAVATNGPVDARDEYLQRLPVLDAIDTPEADGDVVVDDPTTVTSYAYEGATRSAAPGIRPSSPSASFAVERDGRSLLCRHAGGWRFPRGELAVWSGIQPEPLEWNGPSDAQFVTEGDTAVIREFGLDADWIEIVWNPPFSSIFDDEFPIVLDRTPNPF